MSRRKITAGQTSVTLGIFVQDTSSTTGGGLSGLTHLTAGLVAEYRREGQSTWTTISLVAGTLGTFTSGGIVADGSLAGAYEFDPPDAAFATGAKWVKIRLRGAANMLPVLLEFELSVANDQAAAYGALTTLGTNAPANWINTAAIVDNLLTAAKIADGALVSEKFGADAIAEFQAGLATATALAAVNAKTTNLPTDPADASDIATAFGTVNATLATIAGYIDTEIATLIAGVNAINAKTANLPTDPADASDIATAFSAVNASIANLLRIGQRYRFTNNLSGTGFDEVTVTQV